MTTYNVLPLGLYTRFFTLSTASVGARVFFPAGLVQVINLTAPVVLLHTCIPFVYSAWIHFSSLFSLDTGMLVWVLPSGLLHNSSLSNDFVHTLSWSLACTIVMYMYMYICTIMYIIVVITRNDRLPIWSAYTYTCTCKCTSVSKFVNENDEYRH